MREFTDFGAEEIARTQVDALNQYDRDGDRNGYGYYEGEVNFYSARNMFVEVFSPAYMVNDPQTQNDMIRMYEGEYGWDIYYIDSEESLDTDFSYTETYNGNNYGASLFGWSTCDIYMADGTNTESQQAFYNENGYMDHFTGYIYIPEDAMGYSRFNT